MKVEKIRVENNLGRRIAFKWDVEDGYLEDGFLKKYIVPTEINIRLSEYKDESSQDYLGHGMSYIIKGSECNELNSLMEYIEDREKHLKIESLVRQLITSELSKVSSISKLDPILRDLLKLVF